MGFQERSVFQPGSRKYGVEIVKAYESRGYGARICLLRVPAFLHKEANLNGNAACIIDKINAFY